MNIDCYGIRAAIMELNSVWSPAVSLWGVYSKGEADPERLIWADDMHFHFHQGMNKKGQ